MDIIWWQFLAKIGVDKVWPTVERKLLENRNIIKGRLTGFAEVFIAVRELIEEANLELTALTFVPRFGLPWKESKEIAQNYGEMKKKKWKDEFSYAVDSSWDRLTEQVRNVEKTTIITISDKGQESFIQQLKSKIQKDESWFVELSGAMDDDKRKLGNVIKEAKKPPEKVLYTLDKLNFQLFIARCEGNKHKCVIFPIGIENVGTDLEGFYFEDKSMARFLKNIADECINNNNET